MNLLEVRTETTNRSGRYDLVVDITDYVDNGMNLHINAASRYLDRKAKTHQEVGRVFEVVAAGSFLVSFQTCRVIEEVWLANSTTRLQLVKIDMDRLRGIDYNQQTTYPRSSDFRSYDDYMIALNRFVAPFTSISGGRPFYYAPANLRSIPDQDRGFTFPADYTGYNDLIAVPTNSSSYNGVLFLPPTDGEYMVEVKGKFYSAVLSSDLQENSWSINHPEILIMATMRELEIFNRNTEGARDWAIQILDKLTDIEFDVVDEETTEITQMEG